MSSVARASARGVASLGAARALAFGLQVVTFAIIASHLGPRGFGVYTFGIAMARLFGVVTTFGFKQVVTRDAAQRPDDERWLVPNFLYVRILLGAVGYAFLVLAVLLIGYEPDERDAALVAGTLLVLMAVGSFSASLEIRLRVGWAAIADAIEAVALAVSVVVLRALDADPLAFVAAYVAVNVVNALIVLAAALRTTSYDWRPQPSRWRAMARSAVPLGLASVFTVIYWQTDVAMLARIDGPVDVGQYGAAYRILDAVNVVPMIVVMLVGPVLARSVVEGRDVLQRRFAVAAHLMSLLAFPASLLGTITAWRVLTDVPGFGAYGRGAIALSILSPAIGAVFVTTVIQSVLISAHRQRALLRIAATGALSNAVLNLAAIPAFGLYGAATTTAATEVLVLVLSYRVVRGDVGVRWPLDRLRGVAAATAVMAAVAIAGFALPGIAQVAAALAAYALAVPVLGAFAWDDLGGMLRTTGPTVELDACGVLRARAACREAAVCVVRGDGRRVPWRTALGARLAGCGTVVSAAGTHELEQPR